MKEQIIQNIEEKIGYSFKNKDLLQQAFTHSSYAHELNDMTLSYERLEFLGDAILEMISSLYLFKNNETLSEGELTKKRASLVCTNSLSNVMLQFDLAKYIRTGKSEQCIPITQRLSILEDVVEAIIGAIYLDGGFSDAEEFVIKYIMSQPEENFIDYKSRLQEKLQVNGNIDIQYKIIKEDGPEHDKTFTCQLFINNKPTTIGSGKSKKAANQEAAKAYMEQFYAEL